MREVSGSTPTTPLDLLKRQHYYAIIGTGVSSQTPFQELEKRWLVEMINDNTGTVTNSKSISALWRDLVLAIGQVPGIRMSENQRLFYIFG